MVVKNASFHESAPLAVLKQSLDTALYKPTVSYNLNHPPLQSLNLYP